MRQRLDGLAAVLMLVASSAVGSSTITAQSAQASASASSGHQKKSDDGLKWGPAPAIFPRGAQFAVVQGDPGAAGQIFTVRLRFPNGYIIPPHTHPTDEHVTVLSGDMSFGMGDKMDSASETSLQAGGYFVAGAKMHHYATTKSGAVIQVDMEGPFEITYINPADDPRNKAK